MMSSFNTIDFIAVQCCQCSTMQVKQKKKSSNKWTCVVCNQRQSLRKVFAQGYMAKDLRKFVQSFNMSRKLADEGGDQHESLIPVTSSFDAVLSQDQQRKRRCDWSEYLDPQEDGLQQQDEHGDDVGIKIETEFPKEMFKKPPLRNYGCGSRSGDGGDNLYKPVFSNRNNKQQMLSQEKEEKKCQPAKVIGASQWNEYMAGDSKQRKNQLTIAKKASKWEAYIANDDNNLRMGSERNMAEDMSGYSHNDWETILDDQKVEDDIHPDFM